MRPDFCEDLYTNLTINKNLDLHTSESQSREPFSALRDGYQPQELNNPQKAFRQYLDWPYTYAFFNKGAGADK